MGSVQRLTWGLALAATVACGKTDNADADSDPAACQLTPVRRLPQADDPGDHHPLGR